MTPSKNLRLTRRQMLARSAAAAASMAAPMVIPSSALGLAGTTAPSNRITLGFLGVGMMGRGHLRICAGYPDTQVLAVCDVDTWRRDNAMEALQQIYGDKQPDGHSHSFQAYNDFREVLDRNDIDAVVITTGDRWHPAMTVRAAKAGKDIYCEKPISLTIRQARTMAETVRRHQCVFQTGLQQRNSAEYMKAVELIRAGRIGEVKLAYVTAGGVSDYLNLPAQPLPDGLDWDLWLGPCPWYPYNYQYHQTGPPKHVVPWSCNRAFGAGGLTSGTVHNFDSAHEGLGKDGHGPVKIVPPGVDGATSLTFTYADGTQIVCATRLEPGKHPIPPGWDPKTPIVNFGAVRWRARVDSCRTVRSLELLSGQHPGRRGFAGPFRRGEPPRLAGLHPHQASSARGCRDRRVFDDPLPPGLHRAVDGPSSAVGSRPRRIPR